MILNCKIQKLSDDMFNGKHPNNIQKGDIRYGDFLNVNTILNEVDTIIGQKAIMVTTNNKMFMTSTVSDIVEKSDKYFIFKTRNSTYKLEIMNEDVFKNILSEVNI